MAEFRTFSSTFRSVSHDLVLGLGRGLSCVGSFAGDLAHRIGQVAQRLLFWKESGYTCSLHGHAYAEITEQDLEDAFERWRNECKRPDKASKEEFKERVIDAVRMNGRCAGVTAALIQAVVERGGWLSAGELKEAEDTREYLENVAYHQVCEQAIAALDRAGSGREEIRSLDRWFDGLKQNTTTVARLTLIVAEKRFAHAIMIEADPANSRYLVADDGYWECSTREQFFDRIRERARAIRSHLGGEYPVQLFWENQVVMPKRSLVQKRSLVANPILGS